MSTDSQLTVSPGDGGLAFSPPAEFEFRPDAAGVFHAVGSGPPRTSRETVDSTDPYWYGRRYEYRQDATGAERLYCVPLTYDDVLFPREDDRISHNQFHGDTTVDIVRILRRLTAAQVGTFVTWDLLIDFNRVGVPPMAPDGAVLVNVADELNVGGMFRLAERGGEPLLATEETSLSTRNQDLEDKVDLYFRAGFKYYLIFDVAQENRPPKMLMHHRGPGEFVRVEPNEHGRHVVPELDLQFGLVGRTPAIFDRHGIRQLPDAEALNAAEQAAKRAEELATMEAQERKRAEELVVRETANRQAAEARIRELEERLRRLESGE